MKILYCKYCFGCFLLAGGDKAGSLADVEFTLVWCGFATVAVCFSFALIEFSLNRFLSFFDCFMPAALSRFGTLAEFGITLLVRWPIVELGSSINLPLTMTLNWK